MQPIQKLLLCTCVQTLFKKIDMNLSLFNIICEFKPNHVQCIHVNQMNVVKMLNIVILTDKSYVQTKLFQMQGLSMYDSRQKA